MSRLTAVTAYVRNDVVAAIALLVGRFAVPSWRIPQPKPGRVRSLQVFAVRAMRARAPGGDANFRDAAGHHDPAEGIRIAMLWPAFTDCGLIPEIGWVAAAGRLG
jgi:hypothetical protein